MSFQRYRAYKVTSVDWLHNIPQDWTACRLKHVAAKRKFAIVDGPFGTQLKAEDYRESGVPLIRISNLSYEGSLSSAELVYIEPTKAAELSRSAVVLGDVVIGKTGATIGKTGLLRTIDYGVIASSCLKISPDFDRIKPEFLMYVLVSQGFQETLINVSGGSTRDTINIEPFGNLMISLPPLSDQAAIVVFLDRETAKIDALVMEQQRLMELLKEKRHTVISHAVTKGLNPHASMRDSGVEWLGEVPAHWEVQRLKHVSPQITVGIVVEPSKYYVEEGVPTLRSLNVSPGRVTMDNLVFISDEANKLHSKSKLNAGDLVVVRSGQPGATAIVPSDLDGCNCIDLIIIRKPTVVSEQFLCWFLASDFAVCQFSAGSGGAIQQHFNVGTAANLFVPIPPEPEHGSIATYLEAEIGRIDSLISETGHAIDLFLERRSALISAAVTGQIDVRGLVGREAA